MQKEIYIIVRGIDSNIEEKVNREIKRGYVPIGGIAVHSTSGYYSFYQAMILKEQN